jgi:hypothetical protein
MLMLNTMLQTGAQGNYCTFNSHIARAINIWRRPNQTKKKEKENTLLLCKVCLQSNESLNTPSLPSSSTFLHSCRGSCLFVNDSHCSRGPASMSVNVSTISSASYMCCYHLFSQRKQIEVSNYSSSVAN